MNGLLLLNKPAGITSRQVVDRVELWFPRTRIGHTGTLDPRATGVLILCLDSATLRFAEYVQRMDKTYHAVIRLGATSGTDDADGAIQEVPTVGSPTEAQVREALAMFVGTIAQVPPVHSAAKVDGRRAYRLARRGREFSLDPRPVRIDRIDILRYAYPLLEITVDCGKGTYIRSLARDLGQQLGCGGLVQELQRTRIGPFRIERALPLTATGREARHRLLPVKAALAGLPVVFMPLTDQLRIRQGQVLLYLDEAPAVDTDVAIFDRSGEAVAVARWQAAEKLLSPQTVVEGIS